jgi:hypothetical protein
MSEAINRRRALAVFGAAGLGAVMAACGNDDRDTGAAGDTSSSTRGTGTSPATAAPGGTAAEPYASDTGRETFNDDDGIFQDETILSLSRDGTGWIGAINLDVRSA